MPLHKRCLALLLSLSLAADPLSAVILGNDIGLAKSPGARHSLFQRQALAEALLHLRPTYQVRPKAHTIQQRPQPASLPFFVARLAGMSASRTVAMGRAGMLAEMIGFPAAALFLNHDTFVWGASIYVAALWAAIAALYWRDGPDSGVSALKLLLQTGILGAYGFIQHLPFNGPGYRALFTAGVNFMHLIYDQGEFHDFLRTRGIATDLERRRLINSLALTAIAISAGQALAWRPAPPRGALNPYQLATYLRLSLSMLARDESVSPFMLRELSRTIIASQGSIEPMTPALNEGFVHALESLHLAEDPETLERAMPQVRRNVRALIQALDAWISAHPPEDRGIDTPAARPANPGEGPRAVLSLAYWVLAAGKYVGLWPHMRWATIDFVGTAGAVGEWLVLGALPVATGAASWSWLALSGYALLHSPFVAIAGSRFMRSPFRFLAPFGLLAYGAASNASDPVTAVWCLGLVHVSLDAIWISAQRAERRAHEPTFQMPQRDFPILFMLLLSLLMEIVETPFLELFRGAYFGVSAGVSRMFQRFAEWRSAEMGTFDIPAWHAFVPPSLLFWVGHFQGWNTRRLVTASYAGLLLEYTLVPILYLSGVLSSAMAMIGVGLYLVVGTVCVGIAATGVAAAQDKRLPQPDGMAVATVWLTGLAYAFLCLSDGNVVAAIQLVLPALGLMGFMRLRELAISRPHDGARRQTVEALVGLLLIGSIFAQTGIRPRRDRSLWLRVEARLDYLQRELAESKMSLSVPLSALRADVDSARQAAGLHVELAFALSNLEQALPESERPLEAQERLRMVELVREALRQLRELPELSGARYRIRNARRISGAGEGPGTSFSSMGWVGVIAVGGWWLPASSPLWLAAAAAGVALAASRAQARRRILLSA